MPVLLEVNSVDGPGDYTISRANLKWVKAFKISLKFQMKAFVSNHYDLP